MQRSLLRPLKVPSCALHSAAGTRRDLLALKQRPKLQVSTVSHTFRCVPGLEGWKHLPRAEGVESSSVLISANAVGS